jgi:diguanylate cyclase (GGDEF)-like protein
MENLIKEEARFSFVDIDFDNFRNINDIMGYSAGDMFIKDMAEKMNIFLGGYGFVGRIGGDEFGIIFINSKMNIELKEFLRNLNENLGDKWEYNDREFFVSSSMGVSSYPSDGMTASEIIRNANLAMDSAKREGKRRCIFYTGEILEITSEKIKIADKIRYGLLNNEFELYYQPQFHLRNGQIKGLEVLIRWTNSEIGSISPAIFIPIAEEIGQIFDIEKWIFKNALIQKEIFEKKGYNDISLSINLSSKTLMSNIHFGELEDILDEYNIDYEKITIEITETSVISDIYLAIEKLKRLKRYGLKVALDDFGTGYSSLTHLKKLPIDIIKLDKSFIKSIDVNNTDSYIIKAILGLALDLNYEVVAEGIETKEQYIFLDNNNCSLGQGFLMSRPLDIENVYIKLASGESYLL